MLTGINHGRSGSRCFSPRLRAALGENQGLGLGHAEGVAPGSALNFPPAPGANSCRQTSLTLKLVANMVVCFVCGDNQGTNSNTLGEVLQSHPPSGLASGRKMFSLSVLLSVQRCAGNNFPSHVKTASRRRLMPTCQNRIQNCDVLHVMFVGVSPSTI